MAKPDSGISLRPNDSEDKSYFEKRSESFDKKGDYFAHLLNLDKAHSDDAIISIPKELTEIKTGLKLIGDNIDGFYHKCKLNEQNLKSDSERRIEKLQNDFNEIKDSKERADKEVKDLKQRVSESEKIVAAFNSMNEDFKNKSEEVASLQQQLGAKTQETKDIPKLREENAELRIKIAELEATNKQLTERINDLRSIGGLPKADDVQIDVN